MATRIEKFAKSKLLFYVVAFGSIAQAVLACSAASLGMVNPAVSNHVNVRWRLFVSRHFVALLSRKESDVLYFRLYLLPTRG